MSKISRRTMLVSGSTALMLPILEANVLGKMSISAPAIPKRVVFIAMGYGVNAPNWFPSQNQPGTDYELPPLLESFKDLKSDFSIVQNLSNRHKAGPHGGSTNWLTCANLKDGNSVSCDQMAAEILGKQTRYSSLALAGKHWRVDGHDGYASYGRDGKPVGLHRQMKDVYANLFGRGGKARDIQANLELRKSSLDAILGNAKRLKSHISAADSQRVDEYFNSIRNMEKQLTKAQEWTERPYPKAPYPMPNVNGKEEIQIMLDLMRIAMQSDSTRVMTYMLPTQNILKELSTRLNPHRMSHQASGDDIALNSIHQRRDRMLAELVSEFVRKVKDTKEADGSSLLDHSLIAYGSALRQGHNQANGPLILAGQGGGGIKQGQNVVLPKNTPLSNLWLSVLRKVGVQTNKFANSQRVLTEMGFK